MERAKDWRPRRLADVAGETNQATLSRLGEALRQRLPVAALLFGEYGTGKTSVARILKAGFNCLRPDTATGDPCWDCPHCVRCDSDHNGEWLTYQTWELDGTRRLDREFLTGLVEEAQAGFIPPLVVVDELPRLDEATAQPVLLKFVEDLRDGVFVGAAMSDEHHLLSRHKIHPALFDRLDKFRLVRPEADEVATLLSRHLPGWKITSDRDALRQLVLRSGRSFRECLRVLDHARLVNHGRFDRAFLDSVLGPVRPSIAPGYTPFADDDE